eukprot:29181-Eustigmatos_ZCMA.PRE.1
MLSSSPMHVVTYRKTSSSPRASSGASVPAQHIIAHTHRKVSHATPCPPSPTYTDFDTGSPCYRGRYTINKH